MASKSRRSSTRQVPQDSAELEEMINRLLSFDAPPLADGETPSHLPGLQSPLSCAEIEGLIDRTSQSFAGCPSLLTFNAPVIICGDTHGQFRDVLRLFKKGGLPPRTRYLFLGDYVDRGPYSVETVCLMFLFKARFPCDFFMLRGNHETAVINYAYGFYTEVCSRYGHPLWYKFQVAFDSLPIAALVSERIFCMHGGLSPYLASVAQLNSLKLPFSVPDEGGLTCDLLWSDPSPEITGYLPSIRGLGFKFGADVVTKFVEQHKIDLIVRAHQVVQNGCEFFAEKRLVTVFSAPSYCGQFENLAGMLNVNEALAIKFSTFGASKVRQKRSSAGSRSLVESDSWEKRSFKRKSSKKSLIRNSKKSVKS